MIRLFTGLSLPPEIAADIALLQGGLPGARWVDPADFHITLQFIGNVDENLGQELHEAFAHLRKSPVEVILEMVDVFGSTKPRSVIVSARATAGLIDLHATHERICRRHGVNIDNRKYTPHVTLARLRSVSQGAVADYLDARGYFRPRVFMADRFYLFSSSRSVGGGPYNVEAEYELRP